MRLILSVQVSTSTECKCDTDMTTCMPPDGAIDCRTCSVNYVLEQDGSFVCVKQCPSGYFGSRNLLRCVPCANVTEHCSTCSYPEGGSPECDTCESPYMLRGNECYLNIILQVAIGGAIITMLTVLSAGCILFCPRGRRRVSTSISKENVNMSFIM